MKNAIRFCLVFVACAFGAVGVGADLKGSDALKDLTRVLLGNDSSSGFFPSVDCGGSGDLPAGSLFYAGGDSAVGEAALVGPPVLQQIAPMSRPLGGRPGVFEGPPPLGACAAPNPAAAEGIVFAVDGISVLANAANFDNVACNGTASMDCTADTTRGLVRSKTIALPGGGIFTFTDWRSVLRVLYAGMSTAGDANLANRNCGSPERQALAANWALLFQGNCTSGNCPNGIQHAFRPSDQSGTTDILVALLGLPANDQINDQSPFCNVGTKGSGTFDPTTHVFTPAPPADTNSGAMPQPPSGFGATPPPTEIGGPDFAGNNWRHPGPYYTDFQDADVIRRPCSGNGLLSNTAGEDVCSARGDLGLVLPIWDGPVFGDPTATPFPDQQCATGKFAALPNELKLNHCSNSASCYAACPNGVREGIDPIGLLSGGICAYPVRESAASPLDPRCLNAKANKLAGEQLEMAPNNVDGRVYNLHLWTEDPLTPGTFVRAKVTRRGYPPALAGGVAFSTFLTPMVGAYYRIHQSHSFATAGGAPVLCRQTSASAQLGCLVQASPCSIGIGSREATSVVVNGVQGATALKVDGLDPQPQCVRNVVASAFFPAIGSTYPLARKLYINTTKGFDNVTGDERKMAVCFTKNADLGNGTGLDTLVQLFGLVTLGDEPGSRPSFCEDFNEVATCGLTGGNHDACRDHGPGSPFPKCKVDEDPATCF
jgi:hypothetical protein